MAIHVPNKISEYVDFEPVEYGHDGIIALPNMPDELRPEFEKWKKEIVDYLKENPLAEI